MGLFQKLSIASRERKLALFHRLMQPAPTMRVLDVGAEVDVGSTNGCRFIDAYPWKEALSAVNTSPEHIRHIQERYPAVEARIGDARSLPWPDKHFDIVWSNAVIEHVGDFHDQQTMAREIMRVGKRWFVTTPNRWYPYEFHLRLPFVTWLPWHGYLWCGRLLSYDHIHQRYVHGVKPEHLRLLTASEMASCFHDSRIVRHRVTFMAETLIAVGGERGQA